MVLHKGTKFTVRQYEDDVPYVEHTDDAEVDNSTGAPSLYIEAVSGQRFYIDVEIDDSFDFASSPSIEIACYVDGAEVFLKYLHAKDVARGGGIQGLETRRICCTTTDRFLDGRWMRCSLLFKDIKPDELSELYTEAASRYSRMLGCIYIVVRAGEYEVAPLRYLRSDDNDLQTVTPSRTMVVERSISHTTQFLPQHECDVPSSCIKFKAAEGNEGQAICAAFRYRSSDALELLNITRKKSRKSTRLAARKKLPSYDMEAYDAGLVEQLVEHSDDDDDDTDDDDSDDEDDDEGDEGNDNQLPDEVNMNVDSEHSDRRGDEQHESPHSRIYAQPSAEHNNDIAGSESETRHDNIPTIVHAAEPNLKPTIKAEDGDLEIIEVRPAPVTQTATPSQTATLSQMATPSQKTTISQLATHSQAATPSPTPGPAAQSKSEHDRERRKKLLEMQLEETKLKREEKKLERQLFDLGN